MKVAILHEMLVKLWGAEKVVSVFCEMFPKADLFTLMYDKKKVEKDFPKKMIHKQVFSLPSQRLYSLIKKQRLCLPLMPRSVEKLDLTRYDLVIVSSSGFAHGVKVRKDAKFIVYSHSPARYMWDWTNEYREDIAWKTWLKWLLLGRFFLKLRQWDYYAAQNADLVLANSKNTKKRLKKYHRRKAQLLYPPVETERFGNPLNPPYQGEETNAPHDKGKLSEGLRGLSGAEGEPYYLIISTLTEFKKIELAIEAFNNMPKKKLVIVGQWEYWSTLEAMSEKNIYFAWAQYGDNLVYLVQNSLGLVFPGEEDFGIVPIEVMAAGKPIFALRKWWLTETVIEDETWAFFDDPSGSDFIPKFKHFHNQNTTGWFKAKDCKKQAQKFSKEHFKTKLQEYIDNTT